MEIKSLSKLNSNENTSIEQLVFICNTFDKLKNILFLSNELNAILVDTEYLMEYDKFNNLLSSKKVTDLITRKALKEDFPALIYVQVQAFEESYDLSETYVKQSFYDEDTYLYTTILDGEVVGTCSVDISGANNLIFGLCVIPSHQHQGIGSQMLKNIINDILKTNEKPITICVESENKAALQLYSSSGFNIISQYEYYQTKI